VEVIPSLFQGKVVDRIRFEKISVNIDMFNLVGEDLSMRLSMNHALTSVE
jgi:hypothetical protein